MMEQFKVKFAADPTQSLQRMSSFRFLLQNASEESLGNKPSDISNNNVQPTELKDAPKAFENLHNLLFECESYINWVDPETRMTEDNLLRLIDLLSRECIQPNERYEIDVLFKYNAFEHISYLGALCFFYIQLNCFSEAAMAIEKARKFVIPTLKKGFLPTELVDSFDYVWVFLRIQASLREFEKTRNAIYFPQIHTAEVPKFFSALSPKVQAGVLGLKYYFMRLQKVNVNYEQHVQILRMAISHHRDYYEWHYCLQGAYRCKRKTITKGAALKSYDWEDEVREITIANKLSVNNPRCMLRRIQLLAEIVKFALKDHQWSEITFGDMSFQSVMAIRSYMQEQASKILVMCPTSIKVRIALADIFSLILPKSSRNHRLAKECLVQNMKNFPASSVANYRIGMHFLGLEANYTKAEDHFKTAHKLDERDFGFFSTLLYVMLRKFTNSRVEEVVALIDKNLYNVFWDRQQRGRLHFIKGVALSFGTAPNAKIAVDEFIKAYKCSETAIHFQELPSIQRKYGWPISDSHSKLSFSSIKEHMTRVEPSTMDVDRKYILAKILQSIDMATATETTSSTNKWQR